VFSKSQGIYRESGLTLANMPFFAVVKNGIQHHFDANTEL